MRASTSFTPCYRLIDHQARTLPPSGLEQCFSEHPAKVGTVEFVSVLVQGYKSLLQQIDASQQLAAQDVDPTLAAYGGTGVRQKPMSRRTTQQALEGGLRRRQVSVLKVKDDDRHQNVAKRYGTIEGNCLLDGLIRRHCRLGRIPQECQGARKYNVDAASVPMSKGGIEF